MTPPTSLTALTPREAVEDALKRCLLGMDSNDKGLFESACFTDDMTVIFGPVTLEGWASINDYFSRIWNLVTLHHPSNIRVEVKEDADTASITSNVIAYHVPPDGALKQEDTSYTAGSLYYIDLVKSADDGLWKIKRWEIKVLWTTGDRAVVI